MSDEAESVLKNAGRAAQDFVSPYVGTEHILIGMLRTECTAKEVLLTQNVDEERVSELVQKLIAAANPHPERRPELSVRAEEVIRRAGELAGQQRREKAGSDHLLAALILDGDNSAVRLFNTMEVSTDALMGALLDAMGPDAQLLRRSEADKVQGTAVLSKFSRDLTRLAEEGKMTPVIGREKELNRLITILCRRTKNNPCLMGEPGVGKTAIVESLAQRIAAGNVPAPIRGRRILALDLPAMVAGTKYRGEFEERIKRVIAEASANREIILFLDEIHTLIGAGGAEGSLDAANILKPALSRGEIQLIGATTVDEYRKHIEKDAALERRFQPILVEEPTVEETREILDGLRGEYERHHSVTITDGALDAAARMSARYVGDRFLPDKALDLIDEAAASVRLRRAGGSRYLQQLTAEREELEQSKVDAIAAGNIAEADEIRGRQEEIDRRARRLRRKEDSALSRPVVSEEDVAAVTSDWTGIPLRRLEEKESERLAGLESVLKRRVVGQDEAVAAVARAVRRGRLGLKDPKRPVGSFLFLGPTGVGKTELCKALAEAVYGSESAMIRVDMSEYMEKYTVSRMIGSPPGYVGYEEGGQLSEKVRRNPYSLILFDEIEKAHPDVFNILLQILDDGRVTDARGQTVDFKNTILIMTSNAGAERIVEPKLLGFAAGKDEKADYERMKNGVMEEVRHIFRPEFLNRIDETLVFHSLTKDHMRGIFRILVRQENARMKETHGIHLSFNPAARDKLIQDGYDPKYGARPLRRVLQNAVEDNIADGLIRGEIHDGDEVKVTLVHGKLRFHSAGSGRNGSAGSSAKGQPEEIATAETEKAGSSSRTSQRDSRAEGNPDSGEQK